MCGNNRHSRYISFVPHSLQNTSIFTSNSKKIAIRQYLFLIVHHSPIGVNVTFCKQQLLIAGNVGTILQSKCNSFTRFYVFDGMTVLSL